jgi:hypothetical protein
MAGVLRASHLGHIREPPRFDSADNKLPSGPGMGPDDPWLALGPPEEVRGTPQLAQMAESWPFASPQRLHRHVAIFAGLGEKSKSGAGGRD